MIHLELRSRGRRSHVQYKSIYVSSDIHVNIVGVCEHAGATGRELDSTTVSHPFTDAH